MDTVHFERQALEHDGFSLTNRLPVDDFPRDLFPEPDHRRRRDVCKNCESSLAPKRSHLFLLQPRKHPANMELNVKHDCCFQPNCGLS